MDNGFYAGYEDGSFVLVDKFSSPTKEEIDSFSSDSYGEIRFVEVNDVLFVLMKLGTMNWQDAPFTPHWYDPKPFYMPVPEDGSGFLCQISLLDTCTGDQITNRIIGLGHEFSLSLRDAIEANYHKPFNPLDYLGKIEDVYGTYTSDNLADLCLHRNRYIIGTK